MADGFDENIEFFAISYEAALPVAHHRAFRAIAPLLWLKAGSRGCRIEQEADDFAVADSYAILFDLDASRGFLAAVAASDTICMAFIVTDDESAFQLLARDLPGRVQSVRLYESYLASHQHRARIAVRYSLKDYQEDAVADVLQLLARARDDWTRWKSPVALSLTATTGSGKTVMAAAVIEALFSGNASLRFDRDPGAVAEAASGGPRRSSRRRSRARRRTPASRCRPRTRRTPPASNPAASRTPAPTGGRRRRYRSQAAPGPPGPARRARFRTASRPTPGAGGGGAERTPSISRSPRRNRGPASSPDGTAQFLKAVGEPPVGVRLVRVRLRSAARPRLGFGDALGAEASGNRVARDPELARDRPLGEAFSGRFADSLHSAAFQHAALRAFHRLLRSRCRLQLRRLDSKSAILARF